MEDGMVNLEIQIGAVVFKGHGESEAVLGALATVLEWMRERAESQQQLAAILAGSRNVTATWMN